MVPAPPAGAPQHGKAPARFQPERRTPLVNPLPNKSRSGSAQAKSDSLIAATARPSLDKPVPSRPHCKPPLFKPMQGTALTAGTQRPPGLDKEGGGRRRAGTRA